MQRKIFPSLARLHTADGRVCRGITSRLASVWVLTVIACLANVAVQPLYAFTLPENFSDQPVIQGLADPDGFAFSPDGRMFISERITGRLRVATYDSGSDTWQLLPQAFHTFNTPSPVLRSGGLRDIAFDPNFASNGYVYAFYTHGGTLHNRVVRIRASVGNPNVADAGFGEQLLIDLPFNDTASSGSHNGGALEFGADNKLYITTGDGWEGDFAGDPVQSLSTFTGKVLRINADGSIPTDNPFFNTAAGSFRAIYALGLRNPYSMSRHPDTDVLYINEARGTAKASIYIVAPGANYQHEGSGPGTATAVWANAATAGGELITGGAWMPEAGVGNYPATYAGRYFAALWGGNSSATGRINTLMSDSNPAGESFATGLGVAGGNGIPVKPVITRFDANGDLYYMLTTYTTNSGQIRRVRYTAQETVAAPQFNPPAGTNPSAITVEISSATADAELRYTTDNSSPTAESALYGAPIPISASTILRAKGFKVGFNPSAETSAIYIIGDTSGNVPPSVDAGADSVRFVGQTIALDGSGTTDPDGNDDFLTDEQWTLLSGPMVEIEDASEEIAYFTPLQPGEYRFQLSVSDGIDTATDEVVHTIIQAPRVQTGLQVLYTFEEESGTTVNDVSGVGDPLPLSINTPMLVSWINGGGLSIEGAADIRSGVASKIISACQNSDALTVEAWLETDSLSQSGPGPVRIVSLSTNTTNRNFTLGQENDRYDTRLRTTATDNNGTPSISVPASTVNLALSHVAYSRDADGEAIIYVNGVPQVVSNVGGDLSNWNTSYSLLLGNEATLDRQWSGDLYLVAVYCESLSATQIQQNFSAGLPPYAEQQDTDTDGIPDVLDSCPDDANADQQNLDGDAEGDACDADIDNDGVVNGEDLNPNLNAICADTDNDLCDDCSRGVDGFGPLSDVQPANDGADLDTDGLCDVGDLDDDDDQVPDADDNCPRMANFDQLDADGNGIGDACDTSLCVPVQAQNGALSLVCL